MNNKRTKLENFLIIIIIILSVFTIISISYILTLFKKTNSNTTLTNTNPTILNESTPQTPTVDKTITKTNTQSEKEKCLEIAKSIFEYDIFNYNTTYKSKNFKYLGIKDDLYIVIFYQDNLDNYTLDNIVDASNSPKVSTIYIDKTFTIKKINLTGNYENKDLSLEGFLQFMTFMIVKDEYILNNNEYKQLVTNDTSKLLILEERTDRTSKTYDDIEIIDVKIGSQKHPEDATLESKIYVNIKTRSVEIKK